MAIPHPFRGLANPREVWAWGMYDLANQSFQLLINTLLFSLYFTQVISAEAGAGERNWGFTAGGAMLVLVLVSPVVGAMADARAWKREILLTSGVLCAVLIVCLAFLGPGMVWVAVLIFVPAAVLNGVGENFLGSFLPEISTPRTVGRVSAVGFILSYAGALVLLGVTAWGVYGLGWVEPSQWRWLFVFAGAWFLAGIVPAMFLLRERARPPAVPSGRAAVAEAGARLVQTVREAGRYRQLLRLLGVAFVWQMGYMAVIYFASVIAKNMGAGIDKTLVLALVMTLAAGIAATLTGQLQDRVGHKAVILASLATWAASTLLLAAINVVEADRRLFWLVAAGWGLGLGSIGTATRATVGAFTPVHKAAEFFGLYGMTFRLSAVVGVPLFGLVSSLAGGVAGLLLMAGFFVAGGVLLLLVIDEREGVAAARGEGEAAILSG